MFARLNKYLLLVAGGGLLITQATATEPLSPLLQTLEKLECATDAKAAQSVLNRLFNISPPGQEWPDEWLGKKPESPALYAGTLDIALSTLKSTAERFPELRADSERVALQWNYCDVLEDQHFQNLLLKHDMVQKAATADDVPLKWEGFRQWGFLTPDPKDRFVPLLLDEIRLAPYAYQIFLHRAYRKRCFPHPETGLLVSEAEAPQEPVLLRSIAEEILIEEPVPYPFSWNPSCRIAKKEPIPAQTDPEKGKVVPHAAEKEKKVVKRIAKKEIASPVMNRQEGGGQSARTVSNASNHSPTSPPPIADLAQAEPMVSLLPPVPVATGVIADGASLGAKGNEGEPLNLDVPLAELAEMPSPPVGRVVLPTIAPVSPDHDIPAFYEDEELESMDQAQSHSTTGSVDGGGKKRGKKKKLRLSGSIADTISLRDGSNTLSASATWSPAPNWFASGNVSIKNGEPGYSWSVGYADWKPGTCSAQINNWGPLKSGEGLALDKAIANVGCKVKSERLEKHKLAASGNLSVPLNGNKPSLSGTVQWNPKKNWYARATASVPLDGGAPSWNYGFGYADQRPGKWRIEYSNYNKNAFPGDNLGDGSITISRGWQY